jgi:hypothetical protein
MRMLLRTGIGMNSPRSWIPAVPENDNHHSRSEAIAKVGSVPGDFGLRRRLCKLHP